MSFKAITFPKTIIALVYLIGLKAYFEENI